MFMVLRHVGVVDLPAEQRRFVTIPVDPEMISRGADDPRPLLKIPIRQR
jgi:hypothetical protein